MALPEKPTHVIQQLVELRRYRIGWHAVQHMFEEGFEAEDLLQALQGNMKVLEELRD